jgi:ATP-binding cassette subfamily F protein 2
LATEKDFSRPRTTSGHIAEHVNAFTMPGEIDLVTGKPVKNKERELLTALTPEEKAAQKAARAAEKEAKRAAKKSGKAKGAAADGDDGKADAAEDVSDAIAKLTAGGTREPELLSGQQMLAKQRAVTGVLASNPTSTDVKIEKFSVTVAGQPLLDDATLELNVGTRYGFIGQNGSGKTNVLNAIALREIPIPDHIDLYHLHAEAEPTERSAIESVVDHVTEEIVRLEAAQDLIIETSGVEDERLEAISDRLSELDPDTFEFEARKILVGLGFSNDTVPMERATKDMSGGWRMRVSLAKALFAAPTLLLLDEPTNHLDLESCVWLEEHLSHYKKCLFVVSHSQDFLNTVCNKIVWLHDRDLKYYGGNYATFCAQVEAEEKIQLKLYEKQQADMAKLADYVEANHANGKAKSAASKDKVLNKIKSEAVAKPKLRENTFTFEFPDCDKLPSPVLPFDGVCFAYSGQKSDYLYENLDIGVDCDSRIALVGPNGCGKSTLLKLMAGELTPTQGDVKPHPSLLIGRYNQHSAEQLDPGKTVFGFFKSAYPNSPSFKRTDEYWRSWLDRFGLTTKMQNTKIGCLSDGQKSRIVFAMINMRNPNLLLLDEPTNHLDVDAIDGLANAVKKFNGGVVLVSHDFRLIDQVADQIWVCENKKVTVWKGTIREYKTKLAKAMGYSHI